MSSDKRAPKEDRVTEALRFVSAYGPKLKSQLDCGGDGASMTKQSFKDECDINKIMARYVRTGVLDFVSKYEPRYGDVSGVDYQRSMALVASARGMFSQLPAEMRARFENDAGAFVEFVSDPENRDQLVAMGLATATEPVEPVAPSAGTPPKEGGEPSVSERVREPQGDVKVRQEA